MHGHERALAARARGRAHPTLEGRWSRHEVFHGPPLRRDIHRLLDLGFVTVRPTCASRSVPTPHAYANGRTYYALDARTIATPALVQATPSRDLLEWHGDVVYRA